MTRIRFAAGSEPVVLTSICDACSKNQCENCASIFERDDYPGERIFCVHPCRRSQNHDL